MKSLQEIASFFDDVSWRGDESFQCRCPCHDDRKASLSVSRGNTGIVLFCHAGCDTADVVQAAGLTYSDITPGTGKDKKFDFNNVVATYNYRNGCRKLRDRNKNFLWQHQDPDGTWKSGRNKAAHVLYQAGTPQQKVYVAEGEKDADNLSKLGLYCVSAEDGAGSKSKWHDSYTAELKEKDVVLIPDNDDIGRRFCDDIAAQISPVTKSLRIVDLRKLWDKLPDKGDISDLIQHYGADRTADLLRDLELAAETLIPFSVSDDVFSSFNFYTVPDLTEEERKPPEFLIDGMLPVGITFLSGAPKIRKSFLALQMAIAVASGSSFFGLKTMPCDVVYLDLEGSKSRISNRTKNMTNAIPRNVFIANTISEKLSDGLVEKLKALHRQKSSIRFVIVDTYSRARGTVKSFGANAYDVDVAFLEPVQRMALEENIAILFVHHDRKGAGFASDSFERLSGTMGISGSADCVLNLITEGKRFDGRAKLEYTPRDAKGGEMNLVFEDRCTEWMVYDLPLTDIKGNPVCSWVIDNVPEPKFEGQFFSYADVFKAAYHAYSDSPGDKIREQLNLYRQELFNDYNIAVQMGVKSHGERGIRLFSVA